MSDKAKETPDQTKAMTEKTPAKATVSEADTLRLSVLSALREIEGTVAAQWMNEKYNDGARAAAQVLRAKVGLTPDEPLPAPEAKAGTEAP